MSYKIYMELIPKPDDVENWKWDEAQESRGTPQNGYADFKTHVGGYAWTATISGSIFEYTSSSAATSWVAAWARLDRWRSIRRPTSPMAYIFP